MKRWGFPFALALFVVGLSFAATYAVSGAGAAPKGLAASPEVQPPAVTPFPDAHEAPPAAWKGPVFKLRQDYPATMPATEALPWDKIDPKTNGVAYAKAVLAYIYEGNVAVDFQVERNKTRSWYHAPWMHAGEKGREFVHGLTRERTSPPKELAPTQTSRFQNWAVSIYNAPGGFTIGQVWKNHAAPNPKAAQFPAGTVSAKLLFTEANETEVPYMKGAFEWDANVNQPMTDPNTRKVSKMRLLQIDIAVRDARVDSLTGWVFGTFTYDGNAPGATALDRMVPVGVMWGNDPTVKPSSKGKLLETAINPGLNVPQHLGWGGRLNGPVDNPISSCLSCHSVSQYQSAAPMTPPNNATENQRMNWFRNIKSNQPFTAGQTSLGYSLQLSVGIINCIDAQVCAVPSAAPAKKMTTASGGAKKSPKKAAPPPKVTIYKPTREGDN